MKIFAPIPVTLLSAAALLLTAVPPAQSAGVVGKRPSVRVHGSFRLPDAIATPQVGTIVLAMSDAATAKALQPIDDATAECRSFGDAYLASCVAASLRSAARAMGSKPDYRDARKVLVDAARKLEGLTKAQADKTAPRQRGRNGRYRAVKPELAKAVNKAALTIVQEAETKLLRSSGSGLRMVHYQRIAKAVGSTKVILRS